MGSLGPCSQWLLTGYVWWVRGASRNPVSFQVRLLIWEVRWHLFLLLGWDRKATTCFTDGHEHLLCAHHASSCAAFKGM